MFSREVVEFSAKGLDVLKAETKKTEQAIDDLRKANRKLKQEMRDGSWEKQARALSTTRRELTAVRVETERLQRAQRLAGFRGQYGRTLGTAMHYGSMAGGRLQGIANGIGGGFSGMLGLGSALGVGLGVSSLAQRGFSGTAGAARADAALDRLGRHIAADLMPALNAFTNIINRVSGARERTATGRGSFTDRAISVGTNGNVLMAGAAWTGVSALGYRPMTHALGKAAYYVPPAAQRFAGAAMDSPISGSAAKFGGGALALYMGYRGVRANLRGGNINDDTRKRGLGQFSDSDISENRDLVEKSQRFSTEGDRLKYLKGESSRLMKEDRELTDKRQGRNLFQLAGDWLVGSYDSDTRKQREINKRLGIAQSLQRDSQAATKDRSMMLVQGAGERRDAAGLYEELASRVPIDLQGEEKKKGGGSDGSMLGDILTALTEIRDRIVQATS